LIHFEEFTNFMVAHVQDSDSKDEILESFKALAGDKVGVPLSLSFSLPPSLSLPPSPSLDSLN